LRKKYTKVKKENTKLREHVKQLENKIKEFELNADINNMNIVTTNE